MTRRLPPIMLGLLLLGACDDDSETAKPEPVAMTEEALGYYCQMNILEHDGPVAQIHRAGFDLPIWFSQVRDAIAYTRLPEETDDVTAFYVSDMGNNPSGARPDPIIWVDAKEARFVIGSDGAGGMGAPEAVPFVDPATAAAYAAAQGGMVATLAEIPDAYVVAPVEIGAPDVEQIR
jgi:copper chaperone NosL